MDSQTTEFLKQVGLIARQRGYLCYVVGGFVRDDLLNVQSLDLDFAVASVTGDKQTQFVGVEFAEYLYNSGIDVFKLKSIIPKKLVKFKKYGTAKIFFNKSENSELSTEGQVGTENFANYIIDFSTCRKESYPIPGAAPQVSSGALKDDLLRRDFSVNALGLSVMPENFGEIVDYCNGRADLEKRELNVLHAKSFEDDPTRLLRGLRYLHRFSKFGFHFGEETRKLFEQAAQGNFISNVPATRLKEEFLKVKQENCAEEILSEMQKIDLLNPCLLSLKI